MDSNGASRHRALDAVHTGMRLFDEGEPPIPLTLVSSQTFKTGVLNVVYAPAELAGNPGYQDAKVHLSQPELERGPRSF
jgi:hypothetical protein